MRNRKRVFSMISAVVASNAAALLLLYPSKASGDSNVSVQIQNATGSDAGGQISAVGTSTSGGATAELDLYGPDGIPNANNGEINGGSISDNGFGFGDQASAVSTWGGSVSSTLTATGGYGGVTTYGTAGSGGSVSLSNTVFASCDTSSETVGGSPVGSFTLSQKAEGGAARACLKAIPGRVAMPLQTWHSRQAI
jgi:hypothetical protein